MVRVFALTTIALTAFAFNSILCRLALAGELIDPGSFTAVRIVSGALTLIAISIAVSIQNRTGSVLGGGSWKSAFFLFAYAVAFSFAYVSLPTAAGALILFGSVQMTMIVVAMVRGERPGLFQWLGIVVAASGLLVLFLPGLQMPSPIGSALMASAGIAWGFYTLAGRGSEQPIDDTKGNFIRAVPMTILVCLPFIEPEGISRNGVLLAVLSGALASGAGYAVWYSVLGSHTQIRAAVVQLAVPVIAAAGGWLLIAESVSVRLFFAATLTLGGIAMFILLGQRQSAPNHESR